MIITFDVLQNVVEHINQRHIIHKPSYVRLRFTIAYLYLMIGEVWGGDRHQQYLYIVDCPSGTQYVSASINYFCDLLDEELSIKYNKMEDRVLVCDTGQLFVFMDTDKLTKENLSSFSCYDRIFLNVPRHNINASLLTILQKLQMPDTDII